MATNCPHKEAAALQIACDNCKWNCADLNHNCAFGNSALNKAGCCKTNISKKWQKKKKKKYTHGSKCPQKLVCWCLPFASLTELALPGGSQHMRWMGVLLKLNWIKQYHSDIPGHGEWFMTFFAILSQNVQTFSCLTLSSKLKITFRFKKNFNILYQMGRVNRSCWKWLGEKITKTQLRWQ